MVNFNPVRSWLVASPSCPGTAQHVHGCVVYEALCRAGPILGAWGVGERFITRLKSELIFSVKALQAAEGARAAVGLFNYLS